MKRINYWIFILFVALLAIVTSASCTKPKCQTCTTEMLQFKTSSTEEICNKTPDELEVYYQEYAMKQHELNGADIGQRKIVTTCHKSSDTPDKVAEKFYN